MNGDHRKRGAKHATDRVLQVEILGGKHNRDSELAFIPRITLIPSCQPGFNFRLRRRQFPVRLAFSLTICSTRRTRPLPLKNVGFTMSCTVKHSPPRNPLPPLLPVYYNCE